MHKHTLRLLAIAILFTGFAGYSYISAAGVWTAPAGLPPTNNVDTPINTGADQVKEGGLTVSALLTAGGSIGIASNRPMQKFISTSPTDPINNWSQFTESNLVSHLPTMAFAYDRDGNGSYGNDYPLPLVLSVGATPADDNAHFSGKVQSNQVSVGAGNIDITNDAPQIAFNDTSSNNNKWWLHSNAYGIGPTMNFLYDRDNSGAWDASRCNSNFYYKKWNSK